MRYIEQHFDELYCTELCTGIQCTSIYTVLVLSFGTLHTACRPDGGAAFCFSAGSRAFIIAGNLCKDFDVSYK